MSEGGICSLIIFSEEIQAYHTDMMGLLFLCVSLTAAAVGGGAMKRELLV